MHRFPLFLIFSFFYIFFLLPHLSISPPPKGSVVFDIEGCAVLSYVFKVKDRKARGSRRQYALMLLLPSRDYLLSIRTYMERLHLPPLFLFPPSLLPLQNKQKNLNSSQMSLSLPSPPLLPNPDFFKKLPMKLLPILYQLSRVKPLFLLHLLHQGRGERDGREGKEGRGSGGFILREKAPLSVRRI